MSLLSIVQGQNKIYALVAKDENDVVLSIDRVWFTVKAKASDTDANASISKSSHDSGGTPDTSEIEITDGPAGEADIKLVPADSASLSPGYYLYDIWVRLVGTGELVPVVEKDSFYIEFAISTRQVV